MKKILTATLLLAMVGGQAIAHSGRTDSNGGHNCSQKSINKGLCTGYHYHKFFKSILPPNGGYRSNLETETIDPLKSKVKMILEPSTFHTHGDEPAHSHAVQKK